MSILMPFGTIDAQRGALAFAVLLLLAPLPVLAADARAVHESLVTLDTHLDTPSNFMRPGWEMMERHTVADDFSFVDHPRMVEGGLDGGFFVIFTPQGPRDAQGYARARNAALQRAVLIREMVARNADAFELAFKPDDAARIAAAGKRIVYQSLENAYPIGTDLSLLETFYELGVRMVGPVHFRNNDFGDSSTDPDGPEWQGLSPLGRALVAEANRLGMVLDASHASDDTLAQMIQWSATPIILSHSGSKTMFDHPRNIDDTLLQQLVAAGGVIQINSLSAYLVETPEIPEREAAMDALQDKYGPRRELTGDGLRAYAAERHAIEASYPLPRATFDDFMGHVLHTLALAGSDHVGIGLDWDGGGGVTGLEDVADIPKITARLIAEGYGEDDLAKIWSGNVLRLLRQAQAHAAP